jgi:ABC-type dipeptide/oligopeptide/nickel transport system permease component
MTKKPTKKPSDANSGYLLKIVLYLMLGSIWIKVSNNNSWQIPVPIGLIIGLVYASHEHFKIDQKIEYAILLVSAFIAFWLPLGLYINL